jgi:hypothetical protein
MAQKAMGSGIYCPNRQSLLCSQKRSAAGSGRPESRHHAVSAKRPTQDAVDGFLDRAILSNSNRFEATLLRRRVPLRRSVPSPRGLPPKRRTPSACDPGRGEVPRETRITWRGFGRLDVWSAGGPPGLGRTRTAPAKSKKTVPPYWYQFATTPLLPSLSYPPPTP